jgi:hypothetical protein
MARFACSFAVGDICIWVVATEPATADLGRFLLGSIGPMRAGSFRDQDANKRSFISRPLLDIQSIRRLIALCPNANIPGVSSIFESLSTACRELRTG